MSRVLLSLALLSALGLVVLPPPSYGDCLSGNCGPVGPSVDFRPLWATNEAPATLTVAVPEGAVVSFGDCPTSQTGTSRVYQSPPLQAGKTYYYTVKACFGGRCHTKTVYLRAGDNLNLDFSDTEAPKCKCRDGEKCRCDGDCPCCPGCEHCGKDCHCGPGCKCEGDCSDGCRNNGIERDKLSKVERVTVQGRIVTPEEAKSLIQSSSLFSGNVPSDGTEPVVTVKGDKALRDRVSKDFQAEPLKTALAGFRVQLYDPSDKMTSDRSGTEMYPRAGVYINASDGKCLSYTPTYSPSGLLTALRKVKPVQWDKVPDLTQDQPAPSPGPSPILPDSVSWPVGVTFLGTLAAVGYLLTRKS